jgi:hypothetical protein
MFMSNKKQLSLVKTSVEFKTADSFLQNLYSAAEEVSRKNETDFGGRTVLVEGGGYNALWIETQPMGGEMYAKRNLDAAVNNVLFFMEYQLFTGRYPGRVSYTDRPAPSYSHLQGFCFPYHALNLFYWNKKRDMDYLQRLYQSLEAYDNYLWSCRDSDGDGCLELWCVGDTGEDHSSRFGLENKFHYWTGELAPENNPVFPVESMDMMGYSCDARFTLAKIAALLQNGKDAEWENQAQAVQKKIHSYLWDERRGACFDRDAANKTIPVLVHNNLRAMYFNAFTQDMADRFVREHLLNPEEFFTPFPLTSIAVNDPAFRNNSENDWSGQPEGLTYQRTIRALENYGYLSELTLFGRKLINNLGRRNTFPQQFDPFTGEFSEAESRTSYGPTALSTLEYISRFYGIHVQFDEIYWGCLGNGEHKQSYVQYWGEEKYSVETKPEGITGLINGKEVFTVSPGVRVVTDWNGRVSKIINISGKVLTLEYRIGGKKNQTLLQPNQIEQISQAIC